MNKNLFFKIFSITLFVVNVITILFLLMSFILALTKTILLSNLHLIIFIILLAINLIYLTYLIFILISNKKSKKR